MSEVSDVGHVNPEPNPPQEQGAATAEEMLSATAPLLERDCILMLGRRRAGKTIYLATLYDALWKSSGEVSMKALSGTAHKTLMGIMDQLKQGHWPEATLGSRQLEFELNDKGTNRLLVALDYSGEDFRRAFVDEDHSSPEVKALLQYVDRAMAVILLVDASVAVKGSHDEFIDDDFGMVQAIERLHNWPGGSKVPVVLAMTKADRNRDLLLQAGSMRDFVQRHYPALLRTHEALSIFAVSAVQERAGEDGSRRPSPDSTPVNVVKPLKHCLKQIRRRESEKRKEERRRAAEEAEYQRFEEEDRLVRAVHAKVAFLVASILIVGMCVAFLIWYLRG